MEKTSWWGRTSAWLNAKKLQKPTNQPNKNSYRVNQLWKKGQASQDCFEFMKGESKKGQSPTRT